jgi:hypothetical protein
MYLKWTDRANTDLQTIKRFSKHAGVCVCVLWQTRAIITHNAEPASPLCRLTAVICLLVRLTSRSKKDDLDSINHFASITGTSVDRIIAITFGYPRQPTTLNCVDAILNATMINSECIADHADD